jgi:hypothetical protein
MRLEGPSVRIVAVPIDAVAKPPIPVAAPVVEPPLAVR